MKEPYFDSELKQYVLDAAMQAPPQVFSQLNDEDRRIINQIHKASLSQCLNLLGKLGYRFAIVVGNRKRVLDVNIPVYVWQAIARFFRKKLTTMAGPGLKDWGLFVRTDNRIIHGLSLLSLSINARTMMALRDHEAIAQHMENLSGIRVAPETLDQSKQLIDGYLSQAYSIWFRFRPENFEAKKFGITYLQLPVLFFLATRRGLLTSPDECSLHLAQYRNLQKMKELLDKLVASGHLLSYSQGNMQQHLYQLSAYGEHVLNQIRNLIFYQTT